jgi:hypothetical protein
MARTNYSFNKRQRELAKKQKREEKKQRRLERKETVPGDPSQAQDDTTPADAAPAEVAPPVES